MRRYLLALLVVLGFVSHAVADPLRSAAWDDLAAKYLAGAPVVFDDRVKVVIPIVVENQAQVPVSADARALGRVERLVVLADLSPIQHVLTLTPSRSDPFVAFRMKVEQATPIRVAALSDGVWHVGSTYLDAMGGGCSAPAMARKDKDWSLTVGQSQGQLWREQNGTARLRLRVRHPMDTGLARDNTPAYFIERFDMKTTGGESLAVLETFEPVSEDPTLALSLRLSNAEPSVIIDARDNNGGVFRSVVSAMRQTGSLSTGITPQ